LSPTVPGRAAASRGRRLSQSHRRRRVAVAHLSLLLLLSILCSHIQRRPWAVCIGNSVAIQQKKKKKWLRC
jgi:hypothetical protein